MAHHQTTRRHQRHHHHPGIYRFFFIAGGPVKFIENITFIHIQNQAQNLGLNKDDFEKVKASGVLKGGLMKGLKELSRSQKEKIKKFSLFKGMSSEKTELKEIFSKR